MDKFAILGTYEYGNRNNIEVIAISDNYEELLKIIDAINIVNEKLEGKDRDISNNEIRCLINEGLSSVDIVDEITDFIHEINITGIFRLEDCNYITIECPKCKKILFEGTKKQAERLVIYCTDCSH